MQIDPHRPPRVGDLVVYIRRDTLVAHRVVRLLGQHIWTRGDNQGEPSEQVPLRAVVGPISRILREDGSVVERGSAGQILGDWAWVRAPAVMKVVARLRNLPWRARRLLTRPAP